MKFFFLVLTLLLAMSGFGQGSEEISYQDNPQSNSTLELEPQKMYEVLKSIYKTGLLKRISNEDLKKQILRQTRGTFAADFLENNPKVLNTFVEIIKDDKALLSLMDISKRKGDLWIYFFVWLGIMFLAHLLKKMISDDDWNFISKMLLSLILSVGVLVCSSLAFYRMFYTELKPTVKIIRQNFH